MREIYWANLAIDALLALFLLFTKRLGNNMYPIALVLLVNVLEEAVARYFAIKFHNNIGVFYFFNPFEYACFAWFFYLNIEYKIFKRLIRFSVILLFSFVMGYLYFFIKIPTLAEKILLDYVIVVKGFMLIIWAIAYVINIFDQIGKYQKLNVFVLMVAAAILFYSSFSIIFHLLDTYLMNYSEAHNVPLTVMLSPQNKSRMYASKQYVAITPLLYLTNILLYLCIFVALIKSATISKKAYI
jgi:hypothetical protein